MCGLAGILGKVEEPILQRMLDACRHRGPDASGVWVAPEKSIGLAHRRLAIIDLSPSGVQPMAMSDGNAWIIFNGEIYNHNELRRELAAKGHIFRSTSDTEVILHAHQEWGEAFLPRLRGMFALALAHRSQTNGPWEVLLARDRLGIKPLYLTKGTDGSHYFGSELATLLASGCVSRRLDWSGAFDVLASGSVRQPKTILNGVTALPGGYCCTWKEGQLSEPRRWWSLEESTVEMRTELAQMTFEEQTERLRQLLVEVTRYHLIADVPVGVFLSGGVDSTAATALMAKEVTYPIYSFSVGLDTSHQDMDELSPAREAATALGTRHFERVIRDSEVPDLFERFVAAIDQPSEDGANTMTVAALAAEHGLKVVLSGVGMDELLAGYSTHFLAQKWGWFPGVPWKPVRQAMRALHEIRPNRYSQSMMTAITPRRERCNLLREHLPHGHAVQAMPGSIRSQLATSALPWPQHADALNGYLYQEVYGYLSNTLLRDADVMTMTSSLELRPLFVDHKLVEFCFSLPSESKCRDGKGKAIFREALKGVIPESTLSRRKQGFGLPKERWINGVLKKRYIELLQSKTAQQVLSPEWSERELANVTAGHAKWTAWTVATLLAWIETHQIEVAS